MTRCGSVIRMATWEDEQQTILAASYPDWEIWYVRRYIGHTVWCARPLGRQEPLLNAGSPGELREYIAEITVS